MKKIISLFSIMLLLYSCSPDTGTNYQLEVLPVARVEIPTEFVLGNTYQIKMFYNVPSSCHHYNNIYYRKGTGSESNVRTIAVESAVEQRNNCNTLTNVEQQSSFNFLVTGNGSYIFKFWTGEDEQGNDTFLEYEVPVGN
jgi:hypothetical protein